MLTTVENVQAVPGLGNIASVPVPWLNTLIGAADGAIKRYLKRDIELTSYTEFYSGGGDTSDSRDIVLKQFPVLYGKTTLDPTMQGLVLPQATIVVASTMGFHLGTGGNPNITPPAIAIQTGVSTQTVVSYTGVTATSFTGCTGGTGTLSSAALNNAVSSPIVFFDQGGYYGQPANSFLPGTLLTLGTNFVLQLDSGGKVSNRGLLRRIGGAGAGFIGFYPENFYSGKLSAYRMPTWPRGDGNIKVQYNAGYAPGFVPFEIGYCCTMLVAYMVRNQPSGSALSSESLGMYSYSVITEKTDVPEIGSIARTLAPFRESSWGL